MDHKSSAAPTIERADLDRLIAQVGGRRAVADIYPLSPLQEGLRFQSLFAPDSTAYVVTLSCRLQGALDVEAFERAWREMVRRHEMLRTAFVGEEVPLQVVLHEAALSVEQEDWRGYERPEQQRRLAQRVQSERERGFEFSRPPLMRLCLLRTGEREHRFIWTSHHVLFDGWSRVLLLNDVFSAYVGFRRGQRVELEPVRRYRDYIAWLQNLDVAAAERYWTSRLSGVEPTPLPMARSGRPSSAGRDHEVQQGTMGVRLSELEEFARAQQVTVSVVLQGVWAVLLSRYAGTAQVVFGVTLSGRPGELAGVERMLGLFINTVALRVEVPGEQTVGQWLGQLQARQSELFEYQYSPLVQVKKWSGSSARTLFESLFVYENYPTEIPAAAGAEEELKIDELGGDERTHYPLTLTLIPQPEPVMRMGYDPGCLARSTIQQLCQQYGWLLQQVMAHPHVRLRELSILSEAERDQLQSWNATAAPYPDRCVHELFAEQAARTPDSVALVYEDQALSYRELEERSNQLAHHLISAGVGPEVIVGLCLEDLLEMVVGLLGILKAGGAYLPLDASYPSARLIFMLEDAQVPVLLTQQSLAAKLPPLHTGRVLCLDQMLCLDRQKASEEWQARPAPEGPVCSENLVYVMYTSGSTGEPKGVATIHRNVVRLVRDTNYIAPSAADVFLQMSSLTFDGSTFELWGALLNGARVVMIDRDTTLSPESLQSLVREQGVSAWFMTTALFNRLAQDMPEIFSSVGTVLFGGEAVDPRIVREVLQGQPPARLLHVYGPTETTTYSSWNEVREVAAQAPTVPIGRPIANTQVYVLDQELELLPMGATGELYIGGAGLARGYLRRPALTAQCFIANPYEGGGARMYRTGDRVRWLEDGTLEFLGRVDDQVKLRGYRIELGEVEAALQRHPGVKQAAVRVHEEPGGERRLIGYVVSEAERSPSASELREHLQGMLPPYMVPGQYVMLSELPLTSNGKLDRKGLPAPGAPSVTGEYVAARTPTEAALEQIWCEVLRVKRVGMRENFFELGGDSILAMQLMSRIRQVFQIELQLQTLFEQPTISMLANHVVSAMIQCMGDARLNTLLDQIETNPS